MDRLDSRVNKHHHSHSMYGDTSYHGAGMYMNSPNTMSSLRMCSPPRSEAGSISDAGQDDDEDDDDQNNDKHYRAQILSKPPAAFTSSHNRFRFPPPTELTPPPSPEPRDSTTRFNTTANSLLESVSSLHTTATAAKVGHALTRAGSVFRKAESSPSRAPTHRPTRSFADFWGAQGTSAPVSLGFSAGVNSSGSSSASTRRPGHARRATALSAVASSLGLKAPSRETLSRRNSSEDEFLALDLDAALFPGGRPTRASVAAYDDLLANAERLFLRMHAAYASRVAELAQSTTKHSVEEQELEDAVTRATSLKLQLTELSARNEDQASTIRSLSQELASRSGSIRMVHAPVPSRMETHVDDAAERVFSNPVAWESDSEESCGSGADSVFSSRPGTADGSVSTASAGENQMGLRRENEALKGRVEELERVIEATLGSLCDLGV